MSPISVLIADAQPMMAHALAEALGDFDDLAVRPERPRSAEQLRDAVADAVPDVAVVDHYLDVTPTERIVADLVRRYPDVKVLVVSGLHEEQAVADVLAAGAVGYVPKSCRLATLADALRRAHAGESPVLGAQLDRMLDRLVQRREVAEQTMARVAGLTPRELEVLEWLAAGYTTPAISERLGATPRTVQTHIRNLKAKTGARTQLEAVRMAHGKAAVCRPDGLPT